MERRRAENCSSVGIIHREACPGWVFMTTKTPGYPRRAYVGKGLFVGGNWVGPKAASDRTPLGTFIRELREEISFGNPVADPAEMDTLFGAGHLGHEPEPRNIVASNEDEVALAQIVAAIESCAKPFGAFFQDIRRAVFDSGSPKNKAGDYHGLVHVFQAPLPDNIWFSLVDLQTKYGNLSNESQSVITSIWEIVEKRIQIAWGQDNVLADFFAENGFDVDDMTMFANTETDRVAPWESYDDLILKVDVEKIPDGIQRPVIA